MKTITILYIFLITTCSVIAQEKLITNSGEINFDASIPFLEEIKAVNKTVSITLEPKTNTFLCVVVIKDFHFNLDLMEQHFNTNYLESERYPKAVFKGKISNFDLKDVNTSEKEYAVQGKLYIHGKFKEIETKLLIKKVSEGLQITSNFPISIADFNIQIPEKVTEKISKTANTKLTGIVKSNDQIYLTLK